MSWCEKCQQKALSESTTFPSVNTSMKPLQQRATYGNFLCCKLACKCTELFGAVAWAATSNGTCGVGYSNVYDQGGFLLSKPLRWRNRPVPCTSDGSGSTLSSNFWTCWVSLSNIINIILYYIILYYIILHYIRSYYMCIIVYCIVLYYITLHYIILYYILLYYIILWGIMLYYIIFYSIILYYILLYYIELYHTILYHILSYYIIINYWIDHLISINIFLMLWQRNM